MTVAMLATGVLFLSAFAAPAQDTVPLRSTLEAAGAQVDWTQTHITVSVGTDTWVFTPGSTQARHNSTVVTLFEPVIITNGVALISAADVARIGATPTPTGITPEVPAGEFVQTIATANIAAEQALAMGVAGITIAIVDAETGFTWTQGFGMADTDRNLPADADTLFQIGSIAKQFTAIAVMQLVEEGLVELDAPLISYIPEFYIPTSPRYGGNSDDITVRMLLNNTSGVPCNWMRAFFVTGDDHYQGIMNDMLDWLSTRELSFAPGTRYDYANNNWVLLGILVSRMTGHTNYFEGFNEYTNEHIFAPLGMTRSTFEHTSQLTNVAQPHLVTGMQSPMQVISKSSAGSLLSSANDMATYMHFLLGGQADAQILSQASIAQMLRIQTSHVDMQAPLLGYGLGFAQMQMPDGFQTVGHSGGAMYYFSDVIFNLENGLGVFVSTNSTPGMLAAQAVSVAILQTALMEKTGSIPLADVDTPTIDPAAVPVELSEEEIAELYALEGFYDFGIGGIWQLHVEDGALVWTPSGDDEAEVAVPMSDGSFQGPEGRYVFSIDGENISVIYFSPYIGMIPGVRVDVEGLEAPAEFSQWIGRYYFVPGLPGEVISTTLIELIVDDFGRAAIIRPTVQTDVLSEMLGMNLSLPTPLTQFGDMWYLDLTPLFFSMEDGNATIDFMGSTFVRS